jgi:hypothetical protein|tara:strand:- start:371 stop:790 length:420 start_codon:yes stop_codon:yes gene_type:complete
MYTENTSQLVQTWGNWLNETSWDYFTTITYKHNIKPRRNERIMFDLENSLKSHLKNFKMFWVMEHTSNNYQTHNHLLIKGNGVKEEVNSYLKKKRLVDERFVKHMKYEKGLGASFYVSKYIKSESIKYDISYSDNYKLK